MSEKDGNEGRKEKANEKEGSTGGKEEDEFQYTFKIYLWVCMRLPKDYVSRKTRTQK